MIDSFAPRRLITLATAVVATASAAAAAVEVTGGPAVAVAGTVGVLAVGPAAVAGASWGHEQPQQLRELTARDLVEGWAEFLPHRRYGCGNPAGCLDVDSLYVFDADAGDYQATPVTRIHQPELRAVPAAA